MVERTQLPRIDIHHSVSSDNFSAALYSELATRTGVERYPGSTRGDESSTSELHPLNTPLRPNPHRLHSSCSRSSLKQCLISPTTSQFSGDQQLSVHPTPSERFGANSTSQSRRYSPLASPLSTTGQNTTAIIDRNSQRQQGEGSSQGQPVLSSVSTETSTLELPTSGGKSVSTGSGSRSGHSRRHKPHSKSGNSDRRSIQIEIPTSSGGDQERSLSTSMDTRSVQTASPEPTLAEKSLTLGSIRSTSNSGSRPPLVAPLAAADDSHPETSDGSSLVDSEGKTLPPRDSSGKSKGESYAEMESNLESLLERTRRTFNSIKDLITFLRHRALMEDAYYLSAMRLSQEMTKNVFRDDVLDGSYRSAWSSMVEVHESIGLNHAQFSHTLQEMVEELAVQLREKERVRRQLKDTAHRQRKTLSEAEKHLEKTRDKFSNHSEDLERVILRKKGIVENSSLRKPRSKSMSNTVAMILGRDSSSGDISKAEKDARNKAEHSNDAYKAQLSVTSSVRHDYFTVLLPSMLAALRSIAEESDLALSLYLAKYTRAYEQSLFADATLVKPVDQRSTAKGLLPIVQTIDNEGDLAQFMTQYGRQSHDKAERTSNLSVTPIEQSGSSWGNPSSNNDSNTSIGTSGQRTTIDTAGNAGGGLLSPGIQAQLHNNYLTSPRAMSGYNAAGVLLSSSAAAKGSNVPRLTLEYQIGQSNTPVPPVVTTCTNFIEKYGLDSEGLYRLSGQNSVVKQFKEEFDLTGRVEKFEQLDSTFDVNNVTSFLKLYFRELPDGLIPMQLYDQFVKIVDARDPQERIKQAEAALAALPKPNYNTLHHMILHLHRIQERRQTNMMNTSNLAIVFGPTLVRSPDHVNPITSMQTQCKIVEHILEGCHDLFGSKP